MKILVTGANGYLGQGIVKKLLDSGCDVVAVDFQTDLVDSRAKRYNVSLFDIPNPYQYFGFPDVILHLAWRDGFFHYSDSHIKDLPQHYFFLKNCIDEGARKICVMGSMHEIGFYEGCINENTPCNPVTPYGVAKNSLRQLIESICKKSGITFQWLRGYYIVGDSEFGNSIFSKLCVAAKEGQKLFPFTTGENQFDFLDYESFCYYVSATILQDDINGIIEICSGKPQKLSERVEKFIQDNHLEIKLQYGLYPERPYDSKALWGNNKKIQRILRKYEQETV